VVNEAGHSALRSVDKLLAERPEKVGHDFSEATRRMVAFRDMLIDRWRQTNAEPDRQRLAQLNSVLSVVIGGHFPLGSIPWPQLEKARAVLAGLVE
jgi:formate dehydrogenase major subunit